jgi:hypothetical protein
VGDGVSAGGVLIGNKFLGSAMDVTTLSPAEVGDCVFDENTNNLLILSTNTGSVLTDWSPVGGLYTPTDGSIVVSASNGVSVGSLSAGHVSEDLLGSNFTLDVGERITLTDTISVTTIQGTNSDPLIIEGKVNLGGLTYTYPTTRSNDGYLQTDGVGNLVWDTLKAEATYFVANSAGSLPIGTITATVSNTIGSKWLLCDGSSYDTSVYADLFAEIGYTYGGSGSNFNVPDYANSILYGDDGGSTVYDLLADLGPSAFTVVPTNYFIKSEADDVFESTWTFEAPLSATIGGVDVTGTTINPLSGDLVVSMPDSTSIKANVSFNQEGTVIKGYNVTSVALTSRSVANTEIFLPYGSVFEEYDVVTPSIYYDGSGYTGAYILNLTEPLSNPDTAVIDIAAYNYYPESMDVPTTNTFQKFDYVVLDDTTILVTISNTHRIVGESVNRVFLDSGYDYNSLISGTRFNVTIK